MRIATPAGCFHVYRGLAGWYNPLGHESRMAYRTSDARSITAPGLARLLARLHPDTEAAGGEYERLRRALISFFDWRGASVPEECADEVIDRLARKLEDTTVEDLRSYAYGIARLVLLERRRDPVPSPIEAHADLPASTRNADDEERRHGCFELCLAGIPEESRSLILRYYEGERLARIFNRRQLAAALNLTENALRSRAQRLRERLAECVDACVSR